MQVASTSEYDAFGPWVLPVSSRDQVPPVFRSHAIDFTRAHDVLKVPREVARRDVTPRSHLYDVLLVLDDEGLEILVREGHRFSVQRVLRRDLAAVETGTELLAGRFSVLGTDGTRVDVDFNGSSLPVVAAFADRLLGWVDAGEERPARALLDRDALGRRDVGLVTEYNGLPPVAPPRRVAAAYGSTTPRSRQSRAHRLLLGEARLAGAVVAVGEHHTVVQTRAEWVRRSRREDLSTRRIVIPHGVVTATSSAPHAFLEGVVELRAACGAADVVLVVPDDQVDAVAAACSGAAPRTG